MGDVNNEVDAADETAGSGERAENPGTVLVLASALTDPRTSDFESAPPATVVELQMKGAFSTLITVKLP